jgi:hypothetical protein
MVLDLFGFFGVSAEWRQELVLLAIKVARKSIIGKRI